MQKLILFLLSCTILLPASAQAQTSIDSVFDGQAVEIALDPLLPQPDTAFTATISDYALPIMTADFRWLVDGKEPPDSRNKRTIKLTSPSAGKTMNISAILDLTDGSTITVENVVSPVYLDIIIEPQTRVPAFYRGRALPSQGSQINATAIVNGDPSKAGQYIYTWVVDGRVIEEGSIRGRNTMSFTMPRGESVFLSLQVQKTDGRPLAKRLLGVSSFMPTLRFYEWSSLYGLRVKPISDQFVLSGSSASVRAEPYHLDLNVFNNPKVLTWEIDGAKQPAQSSNPYEITFASLSGFRTSGSKIGFEVRDTMQVLQGAEASFIVTN